MKKRFILILSVLILLVLSAISVVSAQPYLKQNTDSQLNLPCTIDGVYCSNAAVCEVTIINPEGVVLINNQNMTQNNAVFSINLSANQTTINGVYEFNVNCCDGGFCSSRFLTFNVNPAGIANDLTETYFFIFISAVLLALIILSLYQLTKTENYGWVLGYLSFAYLLIIVLLFVIYQISSYYIYTVRIVSTFTYFLWYISLILFFPFIIGMGLYLLYKAAQEKDVKKYIDMGYSSDEAKAHVRRK
jgi:hypothetical protein